MKKNNDYRKDGVRFCYKVYVTHMFTMIRTRW